MSITLRLYMIVETFQNGHELIVSSAASMLRTAIFDNKVEAEKFVDILDKARGQQAAPCQLIGNSTFQVVTLKGKSKDIV